MSDLFSEQWIQELGKAWNNDNLVLEPLEKAEFTANISYGFIGEENPRCLLTIVNGKAVNASLYDNDHLDWDLRADRKNWGKWLTGGFGLTKLGPAVATRALQFAAGDYRQMIRNPLLSRPFLRHFVLMTQLDTQF